MAILSDRFRRNVSGPFYVDTSCIDCDLCRSLAPTFFARDEETGQTFVQRQPATHDERTQADEALGECPSESIGSDGEAA